MPLPDTFSVQQFEQHRQDLPDGGRWSELSAGRVLNLSPPTPEQGTVVLNLGKALATYTQRERKGYACFELGFLLQREPATLRFPPVCYFTGGQMFYEMDKVWTERRPDLVVEIPSTSDRRRGLDERISEWLKWGVGMVWALDPLSRQAHSFEPHRSGQRLHAEQTLLGGKPLLGFAVSVGDLFREPGWVHPTGAPPPSHN